MFASGMSVLYYIDHDFEENLRLLYDTKGRSYLHKIVKKEASYKLCRVKKVQRGPKGVPFAVQTMAGRSATQTQR